MASVLRGRLIALIEPLLNGLGYELIELEYVPSRGSALLRIYIDKLAGADGVAAGDRTEESAVTCDLLSWLPRDSRRWLGHVAPLPCRRGVGPA